MRVLCLAALLLSLPAPADARDPRPPAQIADAADATAALDAIEGLSPRAFQKHETFIERELRVIAVRAHQSSRDGDASARPVAERAYALYLAHFSDHTNTTEMRYGHAEILYELARYDDAYFAYRAVVDADPSGKRARFCAHAAVYAAQEMMKADPGTAPPRGSTEPVPLGTWETHYQEALESFTRLFPDDNDANGAQYRLGYLLYQHNQFPAAEEQFRAVIARDPSSRDAMTAANLILDTYAAQKDWLRLRDATAAFLAQEDLGSERFKSEMAEILERVEEELAAP